MLNLITVMETQMSENTQVEQASITWLHPGEDSSQPKKGILRYLAKDPKAAKREALKKTLMICGSLYAFCAIGLVVHLLLVVMIPLALLNTIALLPIYMKFASDLNTIREAEIECSHCHQNQKPLRPYLNSRVIPEMTVQCPECGETTRVRLESSLAS